MSADLLHLTCERDAVRASLDQFLGTPIHEVPKPVLEDIINRLEKLDNSIAKQLKKETTITEEYLRNEFLDTTKIRVSYQTLLHKVTSYEKKSEHAGEHVHPDKFDSGSNADLQDDHLNLNHAVEDKMSHQDQISHISHISHVNNMSHSKYVTHNQSSQHFVQGNPPQSNMKYPSLQLFKFNGEIQNWIQWWGKFEKVHHDVTVSPEDKFEYLLQATEGPVHEIVKKYPPSAGNYEKVMELLRRRYGDPKTLTNYYFRQLHVVLKKSDNLDLPLLYEELRSNICNLESLGLSREKMTTLVPLIESSLPFDVLTAWEESQDTFTSSRASVCSDPDLDDDLELILSYLSKKVESQVKAQLKLQTITGPVSSTTTSSPSNVPTAASLVNASPGSRTQSGNRNNSQNQGRQNRRCKCVFCNGKHPSQDCRKAQKMTLEEKKLALHNANACFCCFIIGHAITDCQLINIISCVLCHKHHHVLMCPEVEDRRETERRSLARQPERQTDRQVERQPERQADRQVERQSERQTDRQTERQASGTPNNSLGRQIRPTPNCLSAVNTHHTPVMMRTLFGWIIAPDGKKYKARCFQDGGSAYSYVRIPLALALNLQKQGQFTTVHCLFGGLVTQKIDHDVYTITLQSLDGRNTHVFNFLGQDQICSDLPNRIPINMLQRLQELNIDITDDGSGSQEIGLLLGMDLEGWILTDDVRPVAEGVKAIRTTLGWTVGGSLPDRKHQSQCCPYNCLDVNTFWELESDTNNAVLIAEVNDPQLEVVDTTPNVPMSNSVFSFFNCSVEDFWNLEVFGITDTDPDDIIQTFSKRIQVNADGRYEVPLPWSGDPTDLGSNYRQAYSRLMTTTRKLIKTARFDEYDDIFNSWVNEGIIERVSEQADDIDTGHFFCHRPVFKPTSLTTPVRPVFDGAATTETGFSINQLLEKGPNLILRIPKLFNNFRFEKFGIVSDIRKAFLQISIVPEDRCYLKFLWWDPGRKSVIAYRHCRVVFGMTPSPFILAAVLNYHLSQHSLQESAITLQQSLYSDNLMSSVSDSPTMEEFMLDADKIMQDGQFQLRQWSHSIPDDFHHSSTFDTEKFQCCANDDRISVLGVLWDKVKDELYCDTTKLKPVDSTPITKRRLLALVMGIYDPIGFTAPVTIIPTVIIQKTWTRKLKWDDELPEDLAKQFDAWYRQLYNLENCSIPRFIFAHSWSSDNTQIHAFCDASGIAYGAGIFARTEVEGQVKVNLIMAKTRVAPLNDVNHPKRIDASAVQLTDKKKHSTRKNISIPRLELLAAQLNARLYDTICEDLRFRQFPVYFWSDSEVVLAWLHQTHQWKVFVTNRVQDILSRTRLEDWRHVSGKNNPADLLSRGCDATSMANNRWWKGPVWLYQSPEEWPTEPITEIVPVEALTEAKITTFVNTAEKPFSDRFAKMSSYSKILRVMAWVRRFINNSSKKSVRTGELNGDEIEEAERTLFGLIQHESSLAIDSVKKQIKLAKDDYGLFCVSTKLVLGEAQHRFKYPVLLPHNHPIVTPLIKHVHRTMCHAGVTSVMVRLREKIWLTKARRTIKRILNECVPCKKLRVKAAKAPIAPLPPDRINDAATPFQISGVDLAGPLYVDTGSKVWIALYTCANFRAIHLELVSDMSTPAFIRALRRFMARRGRVQKIYSDNGTNFDGTENLLAKLDWPTILQETAMDRITWKFNPPASPWWGGFWERLVQVVKNLLKRTLGRSALSYDDLLTIITEVENIVNQRPLTYVTENDETHPITPAMFLQPQAYVSTDLDLVDASSRSAYIREVQEIRDRLRQRFQSEYLALLTTRPSGQKEKLLKEGEIVLIHSKYLKRQLWPLAIVDKIMVGKDGHARTAELRTQRGKIIRPFDRIYPLEISSQSCDPVMPASDQPPLTVPVQPKRKRQTKKATEPQPELLVPPVQSTRTRQVRPPARYR